ncbi:MAG: hypothetical protein H6585_00910 [Flavobacteriales bacterium]|nr:hypothetical protein [Flavobacteriales bacterium]MCB9446886.1 hypothetical protein [Flavobacteriales bacterium]
MNRQMIRKNLSFRPALWLILILAAALQSCQPEDNNPDNGSTDNRDKFTGTWHVSENSQVYGTSAYDINLLKKGSDTLMTIENFYNLNFSNKVTVSLNGSGTAFNIPVQVVSGHTISGSGQVTGSSSIHWNYTVNDGGGDDIVTANYSK